MSSPLVFDLRFATSHYPGVGSYAVGVAEALIRERPEWPWQVLMPCDGDRFDLTFVPPRSRASAGPAPTPMTGQFDLGRLLQGMGAALYHSPYLLRPWRSPCPSILTLHDIIPLEHPAGMNAPRRAAYRWLVRDALRAACVVTDSEASRDSIRSVFGPGSHTDPLTVYPGCRIVESREPWPPWPKLAVLTVGINKPHKNLETLIRALALIEPQARPLLVCAGPIDSRFPDAATLASRHGVSSDVVSLGMVPEDRLAALYQSAALFAFPTRIEGFGLPLLEAMKLGVPAVVSDLSVLREISAGAAQLVPAGNERAWADAILALLKSDHDRAALAERGRERARAFSYEAAARRLVAEYGRLVPGLSGTGRFEPGPQRKSASRQEAAPRPGGAAASLSVLHVYKDFYPPVLGGIEQHLNLLCRTLRPFCDVRVLVSASGSSRTRREVVDGIPVMRAAEWLRVASAPICPTWPLMFRRLRADLYHFHFPNPTGDVSYWLSGARGKIVVTYHSDIVRQSTILPLYRPFLWRLLEKADAILPTSPAYIESSEYLRPFREKCEVVPLGVDLSRFERREAIEARAAEWREEWKGPLVLFVGRLRYYKGLDVLMRAARQVDARIAIVGDGPYENILRSIHRELDLGDRVVFLGAQSEFDLLALYRAARVCVLPSTARSEALGLAMIEAMASGAPVISTELGTGTSWVNQHDVTGRVVPPGDPSALADAINVILADDVLAARYGAAARARAEAEFSHHVMARRVLRVYERVSGERLLADGVPEEGRITRTLERTVKFAGR